MKFKLSVALCASILLLFTGGCKKQNSPNDTTNSLTTENAKSWFTTNVADKQEKVLELPVLKGTKPSMTRINAARLVQLEKTIAWDKSQVFNQGDMNFIVVPVNSNVQSPKKNTGYDFVRSLIFYKSTAGKLDMSIFEALNKKNEPLNSDVINLSSASFINFYLKQDKDINATNAYVFFFDPSYLQQNSFDLSNGKWVQARMSFRSDLVINAGKTK